MGVAIPAAGSGVRMGGARKPFLDLAGEPLLKWALEPFLLLAEVKAVAVALAEEDLRRPPPWLPSLDPRILLVPGGATRSDSVGAALDALPPSVEVVAVHDAARPLLTGEIIRRCVEAVGPGRGAVAGWPAVDTLKEVGEDGQIVGTPPRDRIWHAQTPQVFPRDLIVRAYRNAREKGIVDTDDAALVERIGGAVFMVEGGAFNIKVTRPGDLELAELLLRREGHGA